MESDDVRPIFIGGHHRSGTTLMRVVLHRHPHIACGPEGQLLDRTSFREFHHYLEETWMPQLQRFGFGAHELDRAMAAFIDSFFTRYRLQRGKQRWAEKTPKNIMHIDYLFRLFPQAQFIHMIRDPRDVHCSVRSKALTTTPRWASVTAEKTAQGWTKRVGKGLKWRTESARYLEVRYEDLVHDPVETMEGVLSFLGEPWDDRILNSTSIVATVNAHSNVSRPIFSSSVGRWRQELPAADVYQIEVIAGELMRRLGYQVTRYEQSLEEPTRPGVPA